MFFPKLKPLPGYSETVTSFAGLDRRARIPKGAFSHMENLTDQDWPALSVRPPRGVVAQLTAPGGLTAKDSLIWVDGTRLYINGLDAGLTLQSGKKQLVSMGAYLLIWPDKVYINTADWSDCGSMEHALTVASVRFSPCAPDGGALTYTSGAVAPEEPEAGTLWLDTTAAPPLLRQYGAAGWQTAEACLGAESAGIGEGFAAGDAVEVSGCEAECLNSTFVVRLAGDDRLVLTAPPVSLEQNSPLRLSRTVPEMDFVVECGNRLWGCKYGLVGGKSVNEIYASKLGDFKNWRCYAGLSTDSYAASRGSDGAFTGAVTYLDSPIFFKEQCMERVYPSASGAHRVVTIGCEGVASGSHGSLCVCDGVLYYHGTGGVYAYSGSLPVRVSDALGEERFHGAAAGALAGRYYVSMADGAGTYHLLCYDAGRKLWHRQDNTRALAFAAAGGELFCLTEGGKLLALHGAAGTPESEPVGWEGQSGELAAADAASTYLRRLTVRACLAPDAVMTAELSYDGGTTWLPQSTVSGGKEILRRTVCVRPRRSTQVRLRLRGRGHATVFSVTARYGKGSDLP